MDCWGQGNGHLGSSENEWNRLAFPLPGLYKGLLWPDLLCFVPRYWGNHDSRDDSTAFVPTVMKQSQKEWERSILKGDFMLYCDHDLPGFCWNQFKLVKRILLWGTLSNLELWSSHKTINPHSIHVQMQLQNMIPDYSIIVCFLRCS